MATYTDYYEYDTGRGIMVPDTSTLLAEVQDEFKQVFGDDLDITETTPQGRLIELIQRSRTFTVQAMAMMSNMFNLNKANGFALDDLGALYLLSRRAATYTTVKVTLAGVSGTVVPANTRLKTTGNGDVFLLTEDYTIGSSSPATFRAEQIGAIPCPANTLTIILDSVNGLETATNPNAGNIGQDEESDDAFRIRIKNSLSVNAIGTQEAIASRINALDGVSGSFVYDNYDGADPVNEDGIAVPLHGILVVVDGGDSSEIAQVLYETKSVGAAFAKSWVDDENPGEQTPVMEYVTDPNYNIQYPIYFYRPATTELDITVVASPQGYTGSDFVGDVKNAVIAWAKGENPSVDGLSIGKTASAFEISAAISDAIPEAFITSVTVARHGGAASTAVSANDTEKFIVSASNIQVNP